MSSCDVRVSGAEPSTAAGPSRRFQNDEGDLVLDLAVASDLPREFDEARIQLDADPSGAVLLSGKDHDAPVSRTEVVHDVVRIHPGERQHLVRDRVPGRDKEYVRRARRTLTCRLAAPIDVRRRPDGQTEEPGEQERDAGTPHDTNILSRSMFNVQCSMRNVGRIVGLTIRVLVCGLACGALAVAAGQNAVDTTTFAHPPSVSWPTYNGDYSGRRFSPLTKINTGNVNALSLAWLHRANAGTTAGGGVIKSTPLQVDGVLYFTVPDHVWAVDARTGREIWHYIWKSRGGNHLANRGVGILDLAAPKPAGEGGAWLYFETPDCHLVSLNIKDGTERWHTPICDLEQYYYGSAAPVIIRNHVITGISGDDLDNPGYIESHDPVTGALQWRWYTTPQKMGDPGSETWPNEDAMQHGGGMTWLPVTYDPELNLMYVTTGNPHPVYAYSNRAGANLFTGSIVALNPDSGKMVWYFQSMPHDTHDWDATETAVLIDGQIDGRPRKLIAQAARNGHFFVLDRVTGKALVSTEFVKTNWSLGYDDKGQPISNPAKMPQLDGALVSPDTIGATNWWPPSVSPQTGLFYVNAFRSFSVFYIYDPDANPQGFAGADRGGWSEQMTEAIDYRTGKVRWSHPWSGGARAGLMSTAGNLVFTGGASNDLVALDATTGAALWHARLNAPVSNGPISYELDGKQYVVVAAADTMWSFVMHERGSQP